jgi:hypothetical protein
MQITAISAPGGQTLEDSAYIRKTPILIPEKIVEINGDVDRAFVTFLLLAMNIDAIYPSFYPDT